MAKILFLSRFWYESLSLMQLSAVAKRRGHEADLYMERGSLQKLFRYVTEVSPDLIGFSLMTGQHLWALHIARLLKRCLDRKKRFLIIFGGHHPTFAPEIVNEEGVDIVCRGEGEGALVDLMDAINTNRDFSKISNLWVKQNGSIIRNDVRPLIDNLDFLPFPDRQLFNRYSYFRDNPIKMVMASRGCPFSCSFCFNEKYRELYETKLSSIRRRSCQNVIEELKFLKTRYKNIRIIKFVDDIFTLDTAWLYDFLKMYKKEIKLQFVCHIKAGMINEKTVKELAEACCRCVMFGIETGNENLRNTLLRKQLTNEQIFHTSRLLKKYKIKFYVSNILFIPKSNISDVWETVKINQKIRPDYLFVNIFQPYPGTSLCETLNKNNLLATNYLEHIKDFCSPSAIKTKQNNEEKNIYNLFYLLVHFPQLAPFIKLLVRCKPNILFLLIFKISAVTEYCLLYRLSFIRLLKIVYYNFEEVIKILT